MDWMNLIPNDIADKYEFHNFNNAVEILYQAYPTIFHEIIFALSSFYITHSDFLQSGGNESEIPKRLSSILYPLNWAETKISGDLLVKLRKRHHQDKEFKTSELLINCNSRKFFPPYCLSYQQGFEPDIVSLKSCRCHSSSFWVPWESPPCHRACISGSSAP